MSSAPAAAAENELAAQWRAARQIYPVYAATLQQHGLALEPSRDLEYPVDRNEPEALARIKQWFAAADSKIEVWQLRQILQTSEHGSEPVLRALIARFAEKEERTSRDRDKLDFLLAQYFFQCAPEKLHRTEPTLDDVAQVLEPVLGECITESPAWLAPLDAILDDVKQCESLSELLERETLAHARKLKVEAGAKFFGSGALLTFTRFNILVRSAFIRLIQGDLHAVQFALHALEQRGQTTFDCRAAGLGAAETSERLRSFCQEWKTIFRGPYSSGHPFQKVIQLRELLEAALVAAAPQAAPEAPAEAPEPVAEAAAPVVEAVAPVVEAPAPAAAVAPEPEPPPKPVVVPEPQGDAKRPAVPAVVQADVAAAYKAPPKAPRPKIAIGGKPAEAPIPTDVDGCLEQIAEQLLKDSGKKGAAVTAVVVAGNKLMLSSWEVAAFVQGGDDVSDALQRAVAARALLTRAVEERRQGRAVEGGPLLAAAHQEAAAIQAQIAQAKEKKNIDGAVNLAASARRLIALMEEMEHGPKPPQRSAQ